MKKTDKTAMIAIIFIILTSIVYAAGTQDEAKALVKSAIAYSKVNGMSKTLEEINNPKGQFTKGDLYIFAYDMHGYCVAHGFSKKLIGAHLFNMKDPDGKLYVQERIEIAKTKGSGWQDYKFTNPTTNKIENKTAYIEKVGDIILGSGVYKQ